MATRRDVKLALVYETEALHQHLKTALTDLGAQVVYETPARLFDRAALDRADPDVVFINVEGGDDFAPLEELLADDSRRVIFDDGEVSGRLQGWDLARWTRHLAAKVLGVADVHPPRPEGAVAVPVRVKAGPGGYSEARAADFEIHGAELEHALAADTDSSIERTRAELVTEQEPIWTEVRPGAYEHPEWSHEPGDAPQRADEGDDPPHDAPTIELEFDPDIAASVHRPIAASPATGDETVELEFDPDSLADFADAVPSGQRVDAPTLELEFDSDTVSYRELAAEETHRWTAAEGRVPEGEQGAYMDDAFKALGFIDIDAELPPARQAEAVVDLDTLLQQAGELEQERDRGTIGKSADTLAAGRAADAASAAAAARARHAAPAAPEAEPPALAAASAHADPEVPAVVRPAPKPHRSLQDFEAALAGLSLAPIDEQAPPAAGSAAPPRPAPPRAAPEKPAPDLVSSFGALSLEPMEGEQTTPATSGRASYGATGGQRVTPPPAPSRPAAVPVAARVEADDGLSLEGYEFSFDPGRSSSPPLPAKRGDEDMAVDLDSEIESLLAREAQEASSTVQAAPRIVRAAPAQAPKLKQVWVLGASIGGPDAVREFLGALPAGIPAAFLLAQHVGADFLDLMVQQLTKSVRLRVRTAADGGVLAHGEVVVVPLAERLLVDADGTMHVEPLAETSAYSPSIDQALKDVADRFGASAGVIIFSGMARDAIDGATYLKGKGGRVWVQDPSTCVISSMVDGARAAGIVEFSGSPLQLAKKFIAEIQP